MFGIVVGPVLGVPLDPHHPGRAIELDRLDGVVLGLTRDLEPIGQSVDRLVMERRHQWTGGAHGHRRARASPQGDPVLVVPVLDRGHTREVDLERAPQGDVEHLQTPTDREHRQPQLEGRPHGRQFDAVVDRLDPPEHRRVGVHAIAGRVDVTTAEQQQPVDARQHPGQVVDERWVGEQYGSLGPGTLQGGEVAPTGGHGLGADAGASLAAAAGHGDDRDHVPQARWCGGPLRLLGDRDAGLPSPPVSDPVRGEGHPWQEVPGLVALYGTLMRGFAPHHRFALDERCEFLGVARVPGRLLDLGNYPALVPGADGDEVIVEVYRLPAGRPGDDLLERLDRYEGVDTVRPTRSSYERVAVHVEGFGAAWLYRYRGSATGHPVVPDGDWRAHVGA